MTVTMTATVAVAATSVQDAARRSEEEQRKKQEVWCACELVCMYVCIRI
jgi:hypothetical protein